MYIYVGIDNCVFVGSFFSEEMQQDIDEIHVKDEASSPSAECDVSCLGHFIFFT